MAYNAQNKTGARVAIYVRVSTLHQIDRDSLPMQKQDLLAYAKLMLNTDDCVIFRNGCKVSKRKSGVSCVDNAYTNHRFNIYGGKGAAIR